MTDLPATFTGQFPCADCAAVRYQLNLSADSTYSLRKIFEGSSRAQKEDETGSWGFSSDGAVLILRSSRDAWSWFAMPSPGVLRAVDARGDAIGVRTPSDLRRAETFDPAAAPTLNRGEPARSVALPLSGAPWTLTELQNRPIRPVTKQQREIVFQFAADGRTFSGVSGCNEFQGTVETNGRRLLLKPEKSLRVCLADQSTERALSAAIKSTRAYRITGAALDLFDEVGTRIARLESKNR